jgi:hypothetical protein
LRREWCSQAQSQCVLCWRVLIGRRLRWPLLWGAAVLLEGLRLFIPCAQLGGRLIEGKAYRAGDGGCEHDEQEQALPPDIATTFLVAEFVQMGACEPILSICGRYPRGRGAHRSGHSGAGSRAPSPPRVRPRESCCGETSLTGSWVRLSGKLESQLSVLHLRY